MPTKYAAQIDESPMDRQILHRNNYLVHLAKSVVAGGGDAEFNVVFESKLIAPHMNISWGTTYGLNWTTEMPIPGADITFAGDWQTCELGQSYTVTPDGSWFAERNDPRADKESLNVASNDYPKEVHILVGVKNSPGRWTPIWVGKEPLLKGGRGEYKPLETVKIWFEQGEKTATLISKQPAHFQAFDMTPTPVFFSYDVQEGKWRTPQNTVFDFSG